MLRKAAMPEGADQPASRGRRNRLAQKNATEFLPADEPEGNLRIGGGMSEKARANPHERQRQRHHLYTLPKLC